jgi:hypothetical protein
MGSPMLKALRYVLQKLRCSLCGKVFCTCLPEGVSQEERYNEEARAVISLEKYYMGAPFYRLEQFQKLLGVPLADATLWEQAEKVGDALYPVYKELIHLAAQGEIIHNDDTTVRILSLMKENEENPKIERKGMYTTGIVSFTCNQRIVLFFSGRPHAGENLDSVLIKRQADLSPIIQMADALPSSKPKIAKTVLCNCLAHAIRKFEEISDFFPEACEYVQNLLAKVYQIDDQAKELGMNPKERLSLHISLSKPVMEKLKIWLDEQIEQKLVEPQSSLGKAIQYMRNHWKEQTRFLYVEGAPLDNNVCEQALKVPIRNRKNALFYKSEHGALIGDILMSVIHTCALSQQNPFFYLVALQAHRRLVFRNPSKWLPWNYQDTLKGEKLPESFNCGLPPPLCEKSSANRVESSL